METANCRYNKRHGWFDRREFRILANALALPEDRIMKRLDFLSIGDSIQVSQILNLIERGVFWNDFYRVFNNRAGFYNGLVFGKAIKLIDARLFSFDQIERARLAFDLYEMNALRNENDKVELILQTIKFCDGQMSRMKLEQRLKHLKLKPTDVLHFCQYFDLLLESRRADRRIDSSKRKVSTVDFLDPKSEDEELNRKLDDDYLNEERNWFFKEKFVEGQLVENSVWPGKLIHRSQVNEAARQKEKLQRRISDSVTMLKSSRVGTPCSTRLHICSATLRRTRPPSTDSFRTFTPVVNRSFSETPRSTTPSEEKFRFQFDQRLEEFRSESSFIAAKYSVHAEDYFNELLPPGYVKPIIVGENVETRRIKKRHTTLNWSRRPFLKRNIETIVV